MAPSILLNQDDQACQILLEASRSSRDNISGETISACSSLRDGKKKRIKRVSFMGLNLNSTNMEGALSIRKNTDTSEQSLQKVVPVCRKVRLAKKISVTTSGLRGRSAREQTLGNSNRKYPNIAELNITDSSNVRRNNMQEYSRCPILRPVEKSSLKKLQQKSNTKMSFDGLYWRMPKPGACHSSSRQFRKQVVNIQGKYGSKTEIDKSTQSLRQSPSLKRASNLSRKRKDVYGRRLKHKVNKRTVKLPAFVYNSQKARKTKISKMLLRSSELSAFQGNEPPLNHTEDFQQYIQLTRSRLHPYDVERIRTDGSPVDLVASNSRSHLPHGHMLNIAYRHFTDSKQVIHCPSKQKHSPSECPCWHEKRKSTKQRDTIKSNSTQHKGHFCEKRWQVEGQLNRNREERVEKGNSSKLEKHQTNTVLGPTSAKQLKYKLVLRKSPTPDERTHARTVDPARSTTGTGDLHTQLNSVQSSQTKRHVFPTMCSSLLPGQHGQTSSNQIVEFNQYANVKTGTDVIAKQTARVVESADVSYVREFPTFAAQRRNAAYLAYAKTGRRAKLLGDVIEVVRYDEDSPLPSTGDVEVVRCDGYSPVPSRGDTGQGVSDLSVHKPQSATANNRAKKDSRVKKPKSRKLGGFQKRCSQSTVIAKSKLQDGGEQVCNVTEKSSTGRRSARRVSQKNKPVNRKPARESMSQKSPGPRKSGCNTSKRPRQKRRPKLVDCGQKPPVVCSRPRPPVATSRRRSNPSQSKYRRKPLKVKGDRSHNANIKIDNAKRDPTKKVEQVNQLNDSPNNRFKSNNITLKKPDYLDKPQQDETKQDETKQHERPKLRKCKRRRRRNKQAKYFMQFKQMNSNSKEINRKTFPRAKPFQTEDRTSRYYLVKSGDNRLVSANIYGKDDSSLSDVSGGLSDISRFRTLGVSCQELYKLANCLLNPCEKQMTTKEMSSDNEDSIARDSGRTGHSSVMQRLGGQIKAFTHKSQIKITNDEIRYLHRKYIHSLYSSLRPTTGSK